MRDLVRRWKFRWVCRDHYSQYDPGFPTIPDGIPTPWPRGVTSPPSTRRAGSA